MRSDSDRTLGGLLAGRQSVVLTGAGCSTESGIPDYRGPTTRERAKNPIQYRAFVHDARARQRYWARSAIGWPRFRRARPNRAHDALAALERAGLASGVITQNVDRLHQAAGSQKVIELHGALEAVRCLDCPAMIHRDGLQRRLIVDNPWLERADADLLPDGDASLPADLVAGLRIPACEACGGVLKPAVVFFGEAVQRETVDAAYALVDSADALLVVGSSLAVFSGYRFVRRAVERGLPIAIVNLGPTRADGLASVRVEAAAGSVLPRLAEELCAADMATFAASG